MDSYLITIIGIATVALLFFIARLVARWLFRLVVLSLLVLLLLGGLVFWWFSKPPAATIRTKPNPISHRNELYR